MADSLALIGTIQWRTNERIRLWMTFRGISFEFCFCINHCCSSRDYLLPTRGGTLREIEQAWQLSKDGGVSLGLLTKSEQSCFSAPLTPIFFMCRQLITWPATFWNYRVMESTYQHLSAHDWNYEEWFSWTLLFPYLAFEWKRLTVFAHLLILPWIPDKYFSMYIASNIYNFFQCI